MLSLPWNEAVQTACSFLGLIQKEARFTEPRLDFSHILPFEILTHLACHLQSIHLSMTQLNPKKCILKLSLGICGSHIRMEHQGSGRPLGVGTQGHSWSAVKGHR